MSTPRGWVLYDDSCGFCRRWVPFWQETLAKRGFAIAPLQADWAREKLGFADEDELLRDLQLLLADGTRRSGADAYRYVMKRIWWARPLHLLACAPLLRWIFDRSYRAFATHRHRFSRACRIPDGYQGK